MLVRPDGICVLRPALELSLGELLQDIEDRGHQIGEVGNRPLLLDLRGHSSSADDTQTVILSHHMALHLRGLRVALLLKKHSVNGQRVARALRLDLWMFEVEEEAVEWLLEK